MEYFGLIELLIINLYLYLCFICFILFIFIGSILFSEASFFLNRTEMIDDEEEETINETDSEIKEK